LEIGVGYCNRWSRGIPEWAFSADAEVLEDEPYTELIIGRAEEFEGADAEAAD